MSSLSATELAILSAAVVQLEQPSLAARLAAVMGIPMEKLLGQLPESMRNQIHRVSEDALTRALKVAMKTLDARAANEPWKLAHKLAATLSGATGGMFGIPALVVELPVTTVIILRSIADIARSKGENLADPAARLACLEVFALGSGDERPSADRIEPLRSDAPVEQERIHATYFLTRAALAQQVTAAAELLTKRAAAESGSALSRLIAGIASRFGVAVSEKVAAQAVPIVGAIGGGLINALFYGSFPGHCGGAFFGPAARAAVWAGGDPRGIRAAGGRG
jgi:EcsC protein family